MSVWGGWDGWQVYQGNDILFGGHLPAGIFKGIFLIGSIITAYGWGDVPFKQAHKDLLLFASCSWIVFDLAFNIIHPLIPIYYIGVTSPFDTIFRWLAGGNMILAFIIQSAIKLGLLGFSIWLKLKK